MCDWSSDVCSSDLTGWPSHLRAPGTGTWRNHLATFRRVDGRCGPPAPRSKLTHVAPSMDTSVTGRIVGRARGQCAPAKTSQIARSEEHTSELQSLMRISYAVFCLKKKKYHTIT